MSDRYQPSCRVNVDHADLRASVIDTYSDRIILQCDTIDRAAFIAKAMSDGVRFQPVLREVRKELAQRSASRVLKAREIISREIGNA